MIRESLIINGAGEGNRILLIITCRVRRFLSLGRWLRGWFAFSGCFFELPFQLFGLICYRRRNPMLHQVNSPGAYTERFGHVFRGPILERDQIEDLPLSGVSRALSPAPTQPRARLCAIPCPRWPRMGCPPDPALVPLWRFAGCHRQPQRATAWLAAPLGYAVYATGPGHATRLSSAITF